MRLHIKKSILTEIYSGMARLISRSSLGVQIQSTPGSIRACGSDQRNYLIYENEAPENVEGEGTVVVPAEDLKEILTTQGQDTKISFSTDEKGVATAEWESNGLKRSHSFQSHFDSAEPKTPGDSAFKPFDSGRFQAEYLMCAQCTSTERARFDLDCIALDGDTGKMMATDGRQFYQASGMDLPWAGTCYLPVNERFPEKILFSGSDLLVAKTKDSLAFRTGPWTYVAHLKEASFPPVENLNPDIGDTQLLLLVSDEDAERLEDLLPQLPGDQTVCRQVWLEASAELAVRSIVENHGGKSEGSFRLVSSHWIGGPSQVIFNREYLLRGLNHGHRTFRFLKDHGPILSESEHRSFLFLPVTLKEEEPETGAEKKEGTKPTPKPSKAEVRKMRRDWLEREAIWLSTEMACQLGRVNSTAGIAVLDRMKSQIETALDNLNQVEDKRRARDRLSLVELLPPGFHMEWEDIGRFERADGTAAWLVRSDDGFFSIREDATVNITIEDVSGIIEPLLASLWKPSLLALYYNGERWWVPMRHEIERRGKTAKRRLVFGEPQPAIGKHLEWEIRLLTSLLEKYAESLPEPAKERAAHRLETVQQWMKLPRPETLDLLPLCFTLPASA